MKPKKWSKMKVLSKEEPKEKDHKYDPRPDINISSEELPEIDEWKVGEEYNLNIKVKMKRLSSEENEDDKKKTATFTVVEVGVAEED